MENGLVNLVNRMDRDAYRHSIVCIEDASEFRTRIERPDVEIVCMHRSRVGVWAMRRDLLRLFARQRPAAVHTRNPSGLDALLPAALAGVRVRIHGEHGRDESDPDGRAFKPALLRRLHRPLVHRWVAVSRDIAGYLVDRVGVPSGSIECLCNGVDASRFAPRGVAEPLPEPFGRAGDWWIGTVGRAQPVKDQRTLLDAFAKLVAHGEPPIGRRPMLAIVGDGPSLSELRRQAVSLGVQDRVWLPGARDDVPSLLRALDVFVLPSQFEGISNTVLEAMSSGVPVLATPVGGNVELIAEGVEGGFFPVGDADALAARLARYLADEDERRAHAANARRAVLERFSLDAMVARYRALYDDAVAPRMR